MEREVLVSLAHLLTSMKDATKQLEIAVKKKDLELEKRAKKEILSFQMQMESLL